MKKILAVDDDIDILEALKLTLESDGYEAETITKGEETFQKIEEFRPDLILLDVLLSGKDGRTICKKLKSQLKTKHIPIIMLSAHPEGGRNIREYGADAYIPKPFDIYNLLEKVKEYTSENSV